METGKQMPYGYDNEGRPAWCESLSTRGGLGLASSSRIPFADMRPALQNTTTVERQIQHTFFIM